MAVTTQVRTPASVASRSLAAVSPVPLAPVRALPLVAPTMNTTTVRGRMRRLLRLTCDDAIHRSWLIVGVTVFPDEVAGYDRCSKWRFHRGLHVGVSGVPWCDDPITHYHGLVHRPGPRWHV